VIGRATALALLVVLWPSGQASARLAYCTGQHVTDESGAPFYPNGQRVVDGFGREYYPNGTRVLNDYGDEIRWSNGARVRNSSRDVLYSTGLPVKSATGEVRYPNGAGTRDSGGRCYFETGVEMIPCRRAVMIRERLPGGETAFYQLDLVSGALELRQVRYEFPAPGAVITVDADLTTGRLDRASIGATCVSGR
jgi:hypothetical protein